MKTRPSAVLIALAALLLPGCPALTSAGKTLGIVRAPRLELAPDQPIAPDFVLAVSVKDAQDPATDWQVSFDRGGRVSYDVLVRAPYRRQQSGTFEVTEDQLLSLWREVLASNFDEIEPRYPLEGVGSDRTAGVQEYYVNANGADRRVEGHFTVPEPLHGLRRAVLAVVPAEVMAAKGSSLAEAPKEYVGDTVTGIFHMPDCPQIKDVDSTRRRPFVSYYEAVNFRFTPCADCRPTQVK
jgi:hypothetical protein